MIRRRAAPYKFAEPFSERAGLQHSHLDAIRSEARALDKDLAGKDAEAAAVVARFRAAGQDALRNGLPLPVAPANLRELQQQRDTLIRSQVSILRAALGPDGAAKLDRYLAVEFAPHVSLKALAVPHPQTLPPAR